MTTPPDVNTKSALSRKRSRRWLRLFGMKRGLLALAALPLFQATGCYPDPLGAINFELQRLLSGTLINAFNVIVRNFLDL